MRNHLSLFELLLQIAEVHVFVAQPLCSTEADPIDYGGVVKLIGQHCIIRAQQHLLSIIS